MPWVGRGVCQWEEKEKIVIYKYLYVHCFMSCKKSLGLIIKEFNKEDLIKKEITWRDNSQ